MPENSLKPLKPFSEYCYEKLRAHEKDSAVLGSKIIEYLSSLNEYPLLIANALYDYSMSQRWSKGIEFIENNVSQFPKEFIFSFEIEPPTHVPLMINNSTEEAIYIQESKKLLNDEIVCDNHYLIFDGNDYTIKKYEISDRYLSPESRVSCLQRHRLIYNWRLK